MDLLQELISVDSCNRSMPLEWPLSLLIPIKHVCELLMHSLQVSAGHTLYWDW